MLASPYLKQILIIVSIQSWQGISNISCSSKIQQERMCQQGGKQFMIHETTSTYLTRTNWILTRSWNLPADETSSNHAWIGNIGLQSQARLMRNPGVLVQLSGGQDTFRCA